MQTIQLGEIINATLKSEEKCKQYRLKDILGIGTGGIVYEAQNIWDENDTIAIKKEKEVLQNTLDLYKVMEEKRLDNVVNVIFVKEDYGKSYFIGMEKADGSVTELYEQVKKEKFSYEKQMEFIDDMIKQIANGIYSIHANQIIHRDLKPDNIVYKKNGDKIQYMICDLGLAKQNKDVQEEEQLRIKQTSGVGTPLYMAPELFNPNLDYDSSVDIWAFGVMIYELFANLELATDYELFSGRSIQHVSSQIQEYRKEDLTYKLQRLQLMPLAYKILLEGMIVRNPAQRKNIKQILEDLDKQKMEYAYQKYGAAVQFSEWDLFKKSLHPEVLKKLVYVQTRLRPHFANQRELIYKVLIRIGQEFNQNYKSHSVIQQESDNQQYQDQEEQSSQTQTKVSIQRGLTKITQSEKEIILKHSKVFFVSVTEEYMKNYGDVQNR